MTNWRPLARKEFHQLLRWRGLWVLTGVSFFIAYFVGGTSVRYPDTYVVEVLGPNLTIGALQPAVRIVGTLIALLAAYQAVVGPTLSGSLKLVAGQPLTRGGMLLGIITGRTAAVGCAITILFAVVGAVGIVTYGLFNPVAFLTVFVITLLYVCSIVCFSTGISASVKNRAVAAIGVIAYYLLIFDWRSTTSQLIYGHITGTTYSVDPPASVPLFLLQRAVPSEAYTVLVNTRLGLANTTGSVYSAVAHRDGTVVYLYPVGETFADPHPLILHPWVSVLVIGAWAIVPVLIGYVRFQNADLS